MGCWRALACPARLERATAGLEGRCSIRLSYGHPVPGILRHWARPAPVRVAGAILAPQALAGVVTSCYQARLLFYSLA